MNYLYGIAALCLLLIGVEQYGEHRVRAEWDLERARNKAVAEQARKTDAATRDAINSQHKKDIENAKSQAGRRAVADWVKSHGLLPDGGSVCVAGGDQANSAGKPDETAGQPGSGERIAEFARGCALDALHILRWQEWAVREGLEVK